MRISVLLSLGMALAAGGPVSLDRPTGAQGPGRRECPHTWNVDADSLLRISDPPPANWSTRDVPEYNDCQRFIRVDPDGRRVYTSRSENGYDWGFFAIFASPNLATLERRFRNVARCPGECDVPEALNVITTAVPAAWISAENAYEPLRIAPGANCLLLYRRQGHWQAKMVPMPAGASSVDCFGVVDPRAVDGEDLLVRRTRAPGLLTDGHYPPVARWDWDERGQQQYIGIKCGAAWCEVGNPDGFHSSSTHPDLTEGVLPARRRTVEVRGWYDEQYLSTYDGTTTVPTRILGTTFPDPGLGGFTDTDFGGKWQRVARIAIAADTTDPGTRSHFLQYHTKFNFDLAPQPDARLNEVSMCRGTRAECGVPGTVPETCRSTGDQPWWAAIKGAHDGTADAPKYLCVKGYPMTGVPIPGTTRWRWVPQDEGGWMRCAQGCCEVLG